MSNVILSHDDAETPEQHLEALADMIKTCHKDVIHGARISVNAAREAGKFLIQAKALVPYGQCTAWLKDHCGFSDRTAQKYMRVARRWDEEKIPSLQAVTLERALDLLAAPSIAELAEAVDPKNAGNGGFPGRRVELHPPIQQKPPAPAVHHFNHASIVAGVQKMAADIRTLTAEEAAAADGALNDLRIAVAEAMERAHGRLGVE